MKQLYIIDIIYCLIAFITISLDLLNIKIYNKSGTIFIFVVLTLILKVLSILLGFAIGLSIFYDHRISLRDIFIGCCCIILGLLPNCIITKRYYLIISNSIISVFYLTASILSMDGLAQAIVVIPIISLPIFSFTLYMFAIKMLKSRTGNQ
jgi:hypothetical protein